MKVKTGFVIMKSVRTYMGGTGYIGVTCEEAGVQPGFIYSSREHAQEAVDKMNEVNAVGFKIEPYVGDNKTRKFVKLYQSGTKWYARFVPIGGDGSFSHGMALIEEFDYEDKLKAEHYADQAEAYAQLFFDMVLLKAARKVVDNMKARRKRSIRVIRKRR